MFAQLGVIPRARNKFVEIVAAAEGYLTITHMYKNSQSKKQSFRICLFMKIGWRWTCSQIFSKFRRLENLRLFWMILSTTFAQLMTLSKNNNIIYTRKSFPTNFYLFKANYRSTEKVKIIQSYQQETLRIVTISIIFSTLASLWKFQYFRRPIYNRVKHLWCSFYCENSKPLSIFAKKLHRSCSLSF